jgi:prepilin-type processing-associated H-X9-DG protein
MVFEAGPNVEATFDHVESHDWFSTANLRRNDSQQAVWQAVKAEVAVERHFAAANYLYADGHVEAVTAQQIAEWCAKAYNFALPR